MPLRRLLRLPGWAVLAAPVAACLLLVWVSLGDPYTVRLTWPLHALENYEAAIRPYLARTAFVNSAWLMLLVPGVGLIVAYAIARHLPTSGRAGAVMWTLCLLPVIFPAPLAALAWRPLFAERLFFTRAESALLATGIVLLWRVLPLQCALLAATLRVGKLRSAAFAFRVGVYLVWVDVGTPLLLSAGEPYNASHTFASWTFQTLRVARLWGASAASAVVLALGAGMIVWIALRLRPRFDLRAQRGSAFALALLAIIALMPVALLVVQTASAFTANTVTVILNAGFLSWLGNAALTAALATLFTWLSLASLRSVDTRKRIGAAALIFVLAAQPAIYAPLAWLHVAGMAVDARLILPVLHGGLIAAALLHFRNGGQQLITWIAALALYLSLVEFAGHLALEPARHAHLPAAGIALYLGRRVTEPAALPLALLVIYALCALAAYAFIHVLFAAEQENEQRDRIDNAVRLPL